MNVFSEAASALFAANPDTQAATYSPQGWTPAWLPTGGACSAILRYDTEQLPSGYDSRRPEQTLLIDLLYAEIQNPRNGDYVVVGDATYRIDEEIENDRFVITVSAKEITVAAVVDARVTGDSDTRITGDGDTRIAA